MINIFMPTYHKLEQLKICINSIKEKTEGEYRLIIGDNNSGKEVINYLHMESNHFDDGLWPLNCANFILNEYEQNLGKADVINEMFKCCDDNPNLQSTYTVNIDPDIEILTDGWDCVLSRYLTDNSDFGLISPYYEDNGASPVSPDEYKDSNGWMVFEPIKHGINVAGGLIMMPTAVFRIIGGYNVLYIYGADDAELDKGIREYGLRTGYYHDVLVRHLGENDSEFIAWKADVLNNMRKLGHTYGKCITKGFYD